MYVYARSTCFTLYQPAGSVQTTAGQVWFADDPFVAARPDLFSATPPVVCSTTGRVADEPTPLGDVPVKRGRVRRG